MPQGQGAGKGIFRFMYVERLLFIWGCF